MRILYVSPHFPPDLGALANRVRDLSRAWVERGHEVHVLCGLPGHPTGVLPDGYEVGRFYNEVVDGVHVHRTATYVTPNAGRVRRSASFASFGLSAVLFGHWGIPKPDVIVATSPQVLAALSGVLIGRLRRVPVVVEIRDLWPRSIWEVGAIPREHPVIRVLEGLERWLYREADGVVVVSEAFVEEVTSVAGRDVLVDVVPNGVDLRRFAPTTKSDARERLGIHLTRPTALYAGTHGMSHGLEVVIEAARMAPDIEWVLVGDGARKADLVRLGAGVENLRFLDAVSADEMPWVYAACDVALVPLRDLPLFETVIPSKIFEIWGACRPLVLGVRGESEAIVERAEGGRVVAPEDATALVGAVRELLGAEGERAGSAGRRFVEQHFERGALAERYLDFLARFAR